MMGQLESIDGMVGSSDRHGYEYESLMDGEFKLRTTKSQSVYGSLLTGQLV